MTHPRSAFGAPPQGGATSGPAEPDPRWPLDMKTSRRSLFMLVLRVIAISAG